jgi:hypothetical protein
MGRTAPTFRRLQDGIIGRWEKFRRALRRRDREAFDRMMDKARRHSAASSYDARADPTDSIFMSILLEHEKELCELKEKGDEGLDTRRLP